MTDNINSVIAKAIANQNKITGYRCRNCGKEFDSGRAAKKHNLSRHDESLGIKNLKK